MKRKQSRQSRADREREAFEREARFNVAWGQYGTTTRELNHQETLRQFNEATRQARTDKERKEIEKAKEKYLNDGKKGHRLRIGFF